MTTVDEGRLRLLLIVAVALVGAGLWAFVLRGADGPADPELGTEVGQSPPTTSATGAGPPGDPDRVLLEGFTEIAITVDPGDADLLSWCLLAAIEAAQRSRGLMEVTDLQGYSGMAFLYEEDTATSFYMRNTPTPLSIAYIAADGSVVSTTDMEPCEDREGCPTYPPAGPFRTAIEVFQGDLPALGITDDATVTVGGACAPIG
ncbi:MAG: DUF192 domain-containing protein [Acidimicrobiales bacterium]